jgi:hypothetical protein
MHKTVAARGVAFRRNRLRHDCTKHRDRLGHRLYLTFDQGRRTIMK